MTATAVDRPPAMLDQPLPEDRAWHGPSLPRDRYLMPIPADCLAELDGALAELRAAPVPTLVLLPGQFALDACRRWIAGVRDRLETGPGLVVLDRLPLDHMSAAEAIDLYWLLGNLLEPPVAQEWRGTMIFDVRHDGGDYDADTRGAATPVGLEMHNDSSMGEAPPNFISLLCLQTAKSGGTSIASSALAAHNHFRAQRPDLLERLYAPFYRDHQRYQAADAAATNTRPVFAREPHGVRVRFNARHIFRGYEKTGRTLDPMGIEAVREMDAFLSAPEHRLDFALERGQIQILNNRVIVHGRTPYEDHAEPERRRHLVRLWLRAGDRRQFRG
jgi:alpha-ketoglutarate-dependent taurine dioxygenase